MNEHTKTILFVGGSVASLIGLALALRRSSPTVVQASNPAQNPYQAPLPLGGAPDPATISGGAGYTGFTPPGVPDFNSSGQLTSIPSFSSDGTGGEQARTSAPSAVYADSTNTYGIGPTYDSYQLGYGLPLPAAPPLTLQTVTTPAAPAGIAPSPLPGGQIVITTPVIDTGSYNGPLQPNTTPYYDPTNYNVAYDPWGGSYVPDAQQTLSSGSASPALPNAPAPLPGGQITPTFTDPSSGGGGRVADNPADPRGGIVSANPVVVGA